MRLSIDSSAFAKRYVLEDGSDAVERYLQSAAKLALCVLLVPEIISGLNRRRREGALPHDAYLSIKRRLLDDVRDAVVLQVTPSVIALSIQLLEGNVLRAIDALHVACALEWRADLFITADRRQRVAAERAGLPTGWVGR